MFGHDAQTRVRGWLFLHLGQGLAAGAKGSRKGGERVKDELQGEFLWAGLSLNSARLFFAWIWGISLGFFFKLELSLLEYQMRDIQSMRHTTNVAGGISGACTNPNKSNCKESCSVRIVTIASVLLTDPLNGRNLKKLIVCNAFQKFQIRKG